MELINSKDELIKNIETLEYYIKEGKDLEVIDAKLNIPGKLSH